MTLLDILPSSVPRQTAQRHKIASYCSSAWHPNLLSAAQGRAGSVAEQSALGITVRDLAVDRLEVLGVNAGAEVVAVSGNAEEAGVRVGDVVLRMKGKVIADAQTLQEVAESAEPGDVVPVLVLRQQGNNVRRSYITLRVPQDD